MTQIMLPELSKLGLTPAFQTSHGVLYEADCLEVLSGIEDGCVDTLFSDPPFNLKKLYGSRSDDNLSESRYLEWCRSWIKEGVRVLRKGGSFFLYNLPKWNFLLAGFLREEGMEFRHWIAVEQKNCLPIQGRLYPAWSEPRRSSTYE